MDIFAIRLNTLIKKNKITRYKLAKDFQCSKATIINWCEGINEPKATQIKQLALYFDVSADYLLGIEDESGAKVQSKYSIGTIHNSGKIEMK